MSEKAARPANEYRGYVTVTLPVRVIQRLQPFTSRRARSRFIEAAITTALDKAEHERAAAAG
jgi:metal-responsive CopG/Arc/MetJ family transcriptional regulator